jgi:hypothetical protein
MAIERSAPLLSRVKSWQLVGLGISGWITFYSMALLTWGGSSNLIGNTRGGCFAITMTLAGMEAKRYRKGGSNPYGSVPADSMDWLDGTTTQQLNQTIAKVIRGHSFKTEIPHPLESKMGFGVRAVKEGRTVVFETARWTDPVIDLPHVQLTEANRKQILADLAVIVGSGTPDEESQKFVQAHQLQLLAGNDLKNLLASEKATSRALAEKASAPPQPEIPDHGPGGELGGELGQVS